MKHPIVVAALALSFLPHPSLAAVETMDLKFSGIDWENDGTPADATLRLLFASTVDTDPDPGIGRYVATVSLFSGASSGQAAPAVDVTVIHGAAGDTFEMGDAHFPSPFVLVDGQLVNTASFMLTAGTGDMFSSDALPTDANFAAKATLTALLLTHGDSTVGFPLDPPQVGIAVVPEPSSRVVLAAGIAGLLPMLWLRRKSRRAGRGSGRPHLLAA